MFQNFGEYGIMNVECPSVSKGNELIDKNTYFKLPICH